MKQLLRWRAGSVNDRGVGPCLSALWRLYRFSQRAEPTGVELVVAVMTFHRHQEQAGHQDRRPAAPLVSIRFFRPALGAFHDLCGADMLVCPYLVSLFLADEYLPHACRARAAVTARNFSLAQ